MLAGTNLIAAVILEQSKVTEQGEKVPPILHVFSWHLFCASPWFRHSITHSQALTNSSVTY
jgi:hypothetical protein